MKKVAIIILNWNGIKDTLECLASMRQLSTNNLAHQGASSAYQLTTIVVDNGSSEEFRVQSSEFRIKNIKVIRNRENLGFAGGNNVGIEDALKNGADYIIILNNDTIVDKNLVNELVKTAESDEKIGIVVPKIYFAPGFEFHKDRYQKEERGRIIWYAGGIMDWQNVIGHHRGVDEVDHGQYDKMGETEFASGCCMLVKREMFEKVGMFDERYYLYYEDSDLCERVKGIGYRIIYAPKAILWHKNAGSTEGSGSKLQDYYISRNRLLFAMKYAPLRSKLALLRESLGLLFNGREWQKRGMLDFYLRKFGKGSYPL